MHLSRRKTLLIFLLFQFHSLYFLVFVSGASFDQRTDKSCSNMRCSHFCTPNEDPVKNGTCGCYKGYNISEENKDDCVNVDECKIWDSCSQQCLDTIGSFICSCSEGFSLAKDNRTCVLTDPNIQIIFALKNSVRVWSTSNNRTTTITEGGQTVAVSVDVANKYVFWTEVTEGREMIYRSKINGANKTVLIDTGLILPEGIAFDWITENIYFTDSNKSHIVACDEEGKYCSVVLQGEDKDKPREIALHPSLGLMFWTDWGKPAIGRAGMDGSYPYLIVTTDLKWPNGLAVDHGNSRLYWMDAGLDVIESTTLTGTDRRKIKSGGILHPFGLEVFGDTLYWSDWGSKNILSCNKFTGENQTELIKSTRGEPHGLAIYHPAAQPKSTSNPCTTSKCSHICVLAPKDTSVCFCPAGMVLDKNGKTCKDDKKPKLVIGFESRLRTLRFNSIGRDVLEEVSVPSFVSIGAMVYNPVNRTFIVSDTMKGKIYEYNPESRRVATLADKHVAVVRGLAYDIVGQNLYWVDSSRRRVEVLSLRTGARVTISKETQFPQDLLVIPEKKALILALTYTQGGRILKMNMNGLTRTTLFRINGGEPISLTYNQELERVFWCDIIKNTIEHVALDGRSQFTALRSEGNPFTIASVDSNIFWVDRHTQMLNTLPVYGKFHKHQPLFIGHSEDRQNTTLESYIFGNFLAKLAVVEKDQSRYKTLLNEHECSHKEESKCSHICLMSEFDNIGTCLCPEGMQLDHDGKTCSWNVTCRADEFQCHDKTCIYGDEKCDGFMDCLAGEDELNCTFIMPWAIDVISTVGCKSSEFMCTSDKSCIDGYMKCDKKPDCMDGSDEFHCGEEPCLLGTGKCTTAPPESFDLPVFPETIKNDKTTKRPKGLGSSSSRSDFGSKPTQHPRRKFTETDELKPEEIFHDDNHGSDFMEETLSNSSSDEKSSGALTAIIVTIILVLLALALIVGILIQKKKIQPKGFVRPYVQQLVRYVNHPVKRWRRGENGREKISEENNYDDVYDCSSGTYGKGTYANPTYEEIDGNASIKMMRQNSGKDDGARSSSDSGILTVMDTDPKHLYEELDSHYDSYGQRENLLDKEFV